MSSLKEYFVSDTRVTALSLVMTRKLIEIVFGLVTFSLLSQGVSADIYGYYSLSLIIVAVIRSMSLVGLFNGLAQSFARGSFGVFASATKLVFLAACTAALIGLSGSWVLVASNVISDLVLIDIFFWILVFAPFEIALKGWRSAYAGLENFGRLFVFDTIVVVARFLAIAIAVNFFEGELPLLLTAQLLIPAVLYAIPSAMIYANVKRSPSIEVGNIRYGIQTSIMGIPGVLSDNFDKLFTFYVFGVEALALYTVAQKVPSLGRSLSQEASIVLTAQFSRVGSIEYDTICKIFFLGFLLTIIACVCALFLIPDLLMFLTGGEYGEAVVFAQIMTCVIGVSFVGSVLSRFVKSQLNSSLYGWVTLTRTIFDVTLVSLLGLYFGLLGVCYAFVLKSIGEVLIPLYYIRKNV